MTSFQRFFEESRFILSYEKTSKTSISIFYVNFIYREELLQTIQSFEAKINFQIFLLKIKYEQFYGLCKAQNRFPNICVHFRRKNDFSKNWSFFEILT